MGRWHELRKETNISNFSGAVDFSGLSLPPVLSVGQTSKYLSPGDADVGCKTDKF